MIGVVGLLIVFAAVVGSGVMTAVLFWFTSRLRRLESSQESSDAGLLSQSIEGLTAELSTVREQLDMLEQRTEFNERLLEGRSSDELPAGTEE